MPRSIIHRLAIISLLSGSNVAQAGGVDLVTETGSMIVRMSITEKMLNNDKEYSVGIGGHYVFIASALPDGGINVETIENVANCTGVRPRFGRTVPTPGYFRFPAYVVYYGPYATKDEAVSSRRAITSCVPDAYNKEGIIQRF